MLKVNIYYMVIYFLLFLREVEIKIKTFYTRALVTQKKHLKGYIIPDRRLRKS